jgi:hypothetical protein
VFAAGEKPAHAKKFHISISIFRALGLNRSAALPERRLPGARRFWSKPMERGF